MKSFEKSVVIIIAVSLIMKVLHIPSSGLLFVLSSLILSFFYFFLTIVLLNDHKFSRVFFLSTYTNESHLRTIGLLSTGVSLSWAVLGITFTVQHWKGAILNLSIGNVLLLFVSVFILMKRNQASNASFYNKVLLRTGGWLLAGIMTQFIFVPLGML